MLDTELKAWGILDKVVKKYSKIGLAFSGGKDSIVCLELCLKYVPLDKLEVFLVDTGRLFSATQKYITDITKVRLKSLGVKFGVAKADEDMNKKMHKEELPEKSDSSFFQSIITLQLTLVFHRGHELGVVLGLLDSVEQEFNSFDRIAGSSPAPKDWHYVDLEEFDKLLGAASNLWGLLLALARLAGLRRGEAIEPQMG